MILTRSPLLSLLLLLWTSLLACSNSTYSELAEYTLFSPIQSTETYLIDNSGQVVHTWVSAYRPGQSVYLLENGELLRPGLITNIPATFAAGRGTAGIIEILDWDSHVVWSKELASNAALSHHDVKVMPNGNILVLVWEAKTADEARALGRQTVADETLWADAVYEICRATPNNTCTDGDIVWRWSAWDHVIQSIDSSITATYVSDVAAHPDNINLNYFNGLGSADWTHANAVDYNAALDLVMISSHTFNEFWVIDHGISTNSGILYRWGNPAAYGATGEQKLYGQHNVQWIPAGLPGAGNILLFNNGQGRTDGNYSTVDEICFAETNCQQGDLVWSYSEGPSGSFYSSNISGAQRLANGNTLITEGVSGYLFEVTTAFDKVWDYQYEASNTIDAIFRAYRYAENYPGLSALMNDSSE